MASGDRRTTAPFLRTHLGHEMKHLAFAAVQFSTASPHHYDVPLQDSALVRARAMIDFFRDGRTDKGIRAHLFHKPGTPRPSNDPVGEKWYTFISGRQSHIGRDRHTTFDQ